MNSPDTQIRQAQLTSWPARTPGQLFDLVPHGKSFTGDIPKPGESRFLFRDGDFFSSQTGPLPKTCVKVSNDSNRKAQLENHGVSASAIERE